MSRTLPWPPPTPATGAPGEPDAAAAPFALDEPLDARRVDAGTRAQRHGASAEALCAWQHRACWDAGLAFVAKVATRFKVLRPEGPPGTGRYVVQLLRQDASDPFPAPPVDYWGAALVGPPRHVLAECKSAEVAGATLDLSAKHLKPHQAEALDRGAARGDLVVLYVVAGANLYAIPWPAVRAFLTAERRKSLPAWFYAPFATTPGKPYLAHPRWRVAP